jgi:hypothetical protein
VRILGQVQYFDVVELDVEVLVDRFQDSTNTDVILKLNGDSLVSQSLEEAAVPDILVTICVEWVCASRHSIPEEKHGCGG